MLSPAPPGLSLSVSVCCSRTSRMEDVLFWLTRHSPPRLSHLLSFLFALRLSLEHLPSLSEFTSFCLYNSYINRSIRFLSRERATSRLCRRIRHHPASRTQRVDAPSLRWYLTLHPLPSARNILSMRPGVSVRSYLD